MKLTQKGDHFTVFESFPHYAKSIGAITPCHLENLTYDPLRTSSRDEELAGETKENTITKKYNMTLNR